MSAISALALITIGLIVSTSGQHEMHGQHGHHGPAVGDTFQFDHVSLNLMARSGPNCYLYAVNGTEQNANYLHTQAGLHHLEKTVLDLIDAKNYTSLSTDKVQQLGDGVVGFCGVSHVYKLN